MTLKKNLKSMKAQAVVEYIVTFVVLAAGILVIFGAFNPESLGIRSLFNQAVNNAIAEIQR